jgi:digeranylgeranylglycerophospholipid reductase
MKYMYDVVVVGAGPSGSAAARRCAEEGLHTLLIEEHATIGHPVQCAGLLSCAAFRECRVSAKPILHEVCGARIVSGHGSELLFAAGEIKAVVVDRGALDREMARAAADAGAAIMLKASFAGIDGTDVLVRSDEGIRRIRSRLLIGADGPGSSVARRCGFERSPLYLSGIQAEIPHDMDGRYVELYPDASPDFFGWVIPAGDGRARMGLCGTERVKERFSSFSSGFDNRCLHLVTGTIPLGVRPKTYGKRVLLVGDAAGFAKPTTGGGIYTGVRSAAHAARVAVECRETGSYDTAALSRYEQYWKQDFGKELAMGLRLLKIRRKLSPGMVDECCRALRDPDILETIVAYGDMDRPGRLIRRLIRKPAIARAFGGILHSELKELMKS